MDLKKCVINLILLFYINKFICYFCFTHNSFGSKNNCFFFLNKNNYIKNINIIDRVKKLSNFELHLIFRKLKDQSMVKSIPGHVRRKKKKKKKKKKGKQDEEPKKKVNKKLARRKLLKFYKLKRKNEGKEENVFDDKEKYSVFDYIEEKMKNPSNNSFNNRVDINMKENDPLFNEGKKKENILLGEKKEEQQEQQKYILEEQQKYILEEQKKYILEEQQNYILEEPENITSDNDIRNNENTEDDKYNDLENVEKKDVETLSKKEEGKTTKKKKKLKKLKKNMHIGKYNRKVYTYKKKVSIDTIHEYILNKQLKDKYILRRDSLKNVFVNMPLFNFYNFYNFFQIDHVEKYNKSKILNLIYYYLYKYKNNVDNKTKYDLIKIDDIIQKYDKITDDKIKMNHYLEYYINMNNNKYLYMNIDKDYTLKKKITDAFTISNINKVDSLHIHNYKVIWTIRNVQEKLFWRFREMGNIPLTTSAFTFAGKKSFKLKIWIDGHKSSKKNYVSIGLKQLEKYSLLDEYICFSLNGIVRGPFTYLSKEYYQNCYNFCKFDELDLQKDELQLSVYVHDGIV
ncbi:hypothetical protein PFNF135_02638 [Plasmodium falciparum NF135/5.C10]|uniref:Uncharacterized protein n=1 Tax=Plasmodium falciparum NF135/5.C10 TaxID=1036726 RepID=W4IJF7_PLAFA|nr:hypothetical protein PFNF135_02638 [Plasmodium falciparum NF135/5.C10]